MSDTLGARVDEQKRPPVVEFDDEERPARVLSGWAERLVAVATFAVAILALWQVFRPLAQGSQYYLVIFLAGTLPTIFSPTGPGFASWTVGTALAWWTGCWPRWRWRSACIPWRR